MSKVFPGGSDSKKSACNAGDLGSIPGWEDPLERGMATHSSVLPWEIPWTEEAGGLQSMGSQELDTTEHLSAAAGLSCGIFIPSHSIFCCRTWAQLPQHVGS